MTEQVTEGKTLFMLEPEAISLLDSYGINYPEYGLARSPAEAVIIADKIGYPVVMKVVSRQVVHKSDVGGVRVGLKDASEVKAAYVKISETVCAAEPSAVIEGILVCKQAQEGVELVIGATQDGIFGPTIMFGLGGVFVEVLKDVSFRICPLKKKDAVEMIEEIKGYPILKGTRGKAALDIEALIELLLKVSNLLMETPGIVEMDFNPVRIYEKGVQVLDVRVLTKEVDENRKIIAMQR